MTDGKIIEMIEKELEDKTLGVTEQNLEIHKPVYKDGKVQIDRIDREEGEGFIIAYLPVEGERFHFAIAIDTDKKKIMGFYIEPYIHVYFSADSEELTLSQLKSMTNLQPTEGWNKGDKRVDGKYTYKSSNIEFFPNPEPDTFEDKMRKLLDFLEQDIEGVKNLIDNAEGYIQVAMEFHDGNGCLGGPHLDIETIHRMSKLNLEIDFDLYAFGNPFV
jgi:hypothetical protein